jgi:DNA primase
MRQAQDLGATIAQVKASVRLEDEVRRRGIRLRGSTRRLEGRCPFPGHEDDTPSFSIYLDTQRYYCFGCHAGGDVLDFVREMDGCSLSEAIERLLGTAAVRARRLSTDGMRRRVSASPVSRHLQEDSRADRLPISRATEHAAILTRAMLYYHQSLAAAPFALDYLASRGISAAAIRRCMLGYADGGFRLTLVGRPHLWQAAREVGLLTAQGREWLSGRLIVPEVVDGRCTWLIGRVLREPVPHPINFPEKKYLGLPLDKPILGFGRACALVSAGPRATLLGIHIVEGALDYAVAQEWSLPFYNLALLGTHASRHQLSGLLWLHERSGGLPFLLGLDEDEGGGIGTLHLLEQLRGYPVRAIPGVALGKDLGELAEHPGGYGLWRHAFYATGEGREWL